MKVLKITAVFVALFFTACSSLKLEPVNFGWPLENVLEIRGDFNVASMRYAISLNLRDLFEEEGKIKNNEPTVRQVRIIRNDAGFYFITAESFKHVYVFKPEAKSLVLENKITISEKGIESPAFNQRGKYIELITDGGKYKLTEKGIVR